MAKTRALTSFDCDHDLDLKNLLVGQAKNPDSPFEICDWSIKEASAGWKAKARVRIRACEAVAVICAGHTDTAVGVGAELSIAQKESIAYFLLRDRPDRTCRTPTWAESTDKMYDLTWENLKLLIGGSR
ncbi:hypothetical protein [Mycobacterium spongiae]|uniref:Uncharacterized protein n=1 Tax=Mycobacterium spongiae TaxID=886343 RepID=A0A975PVZ5_9MYCO|nr:hypothetical protein [Mycobacterium spongiae]QUR66133.1 hypothetical protein F6B93_02690 [Mycobacterium spongiae]